MKISYAWLKEFVDFEITPKELAEKLTSFGFEVISVQESGGDSIFEIEITPNRGDCLSVIGFAREISCAYNLGFVEHSPAIAEGAEKAGDYLKVEIRNPQLCARYTARVIKDVKIGPSPAWMSRRLESMGVRSINNVVDVTNYVLLETGQPTHAFDHSLLKGRHIIVRTAGQGESLVTLDGVERKLENDMLVIADTQRAVALAGIMGGANTEVNPSTKDVVIESACFNSSSIRKTSLKMGMDTAASYRFERNSDIEEARRSVDRICQLVQQVAGGKILKGVLDEYPFKQKALKIKVRLARVEQILGNRIPVKEISRILRKLGFCTTKHESFVRVGVPSWRQADVTGEIDVIEEIARHYGYDRIKPSIPVLLPGIESDRRYGSVSSGTLAMQESAREAMAAIGYSECMNYGLMKSGIFAEEISKSKKIVRISNPLDEEMPLLRPSLVPWLAENLAFNANRDAESLKIFEIGRVFEVSGGKLPEERTMISAAAYGKNHKFWQDKERKFDFFDLKGAAEYLLRNLGAADYSFMAAEGHDCPFADYTLSVFAGKEKAGIIGKLSGGITDHYKLAGEVCFFEMDLGVLKDRRKPGMRYDPISKFPAVRRDAALLVPFGISAGEAAGIIRSEGGELLSDIELFDFYQGGQIPQGYKSLAFTLIYQSRGKTLTDEEVNSLHFRIVEALSRKGIKLRE